MTLLYYEFRVRSVTSSSFNTYPVSRIRDTCFSNILSILYVYLLMILCLNDHYCPRIYFSILSSHSRITDLTSRRRDISFIKKLVFHKSVYLKPTVSSVGLPDWSNSFPRIDSDCVFYFIYTFLPWLIFLSIKRRFF